MAGTRNTRRRVVVLAVLALSCVGGTEPVRADDPAKELTEEARNRLEAEAQTQSRRAVQLCQDGAYAEATEAMEKTVRAYKRLYPAAQYPDGNVKLVASLNNLGALLEAQGEFARAESNIHGALDLSKRLYPVGKFPNGCPELARSLNLFGAVLEDQGEYSQAEPYSRAALEMYRKLCPPEQYPDGHPYLAGCIANLGILLQSQGEYAQAEPYCREALAMRRRLYPSETYPDGHPDLAASLNNLAMLLQVRGEYGKAEPYYQEALQMKKRFYPPGAFPDGHPSLVGTLSNLGVLLQARGEYEQAESCFRDAVEMDRKLYPSEKFPDGHPDLAMHINNLGALLDERGEADKAKPYLRDALDMYRKLYPSEKFPDGHPELAGSLGNLCTVLEDLGDDGAAESYAHDALEMYKRLYPADRFPDGHPKLADSFHGLGMVLEMRGDHRKAAEAFAAGLAMYNRLATVYSDGAAEAEILNLVATSPGARTGLLAAASHVEGADPDECYRVLWRGKAALARALERRRRLLQAAARTDEETKNRLQQLLETRADLSRLILSPARPGDGDRDRLLHGLADRKEQLEKELAGVLPASERKTPPWTNLTDHLPGYSAFVDLYWYIDWDPKTRKWDALRCAAFVLRKGRPIRRLDLSDGAGVEEDLNQWRQDIDKGFASEAAFRLRKSVWEPIVQSVGDGVDTVYICPDGDLGALPWPALPGRRPGSVLLEDYSFAIVPSGLFLLEQLTHPAPPDREAGLLLTVGGVRYDHDDAPADKTGKPWPALPATDKERAAVAALAHKMAKAPAIVDRSGPDANVARLLQDLPKARWAHLATHGFFAAPDTQEREHLFRPDDFTFGLTPLGIRLDRRGAAARNPLTQSGLVLAGANQPTDKDTGLLTGEAIAGLDLDGMDLAVLSACRTGLGEQSNGEGVFGLQRAFHIAGARNVVASLWTVDDDATAALMNLFYYHLWEKNEPPLEALHHAQLELYRNPQALSGLAKGRGAADWDDAVKVVTRPPADPKESPRRPAAVRDWAAFVLSGAGR